MSLLSVLLSYLLLYKYVALAVIVYAAALFVPFPSNAMLLAVGAFSSEGYFNFWFALLVAVLANTAGDLTDYLIARRYGEWIVRKLHLHKLAFYDPLRAELRTDAWITVFTTRFAGSLSPVANVLAGLVGVPFQTFVWPDLLGNTIEPGVALVLGFVFGDYWNAFSGPMEIFAAMVAVAVVSFVLIRIYRRITRKYDRA